MFGLLLLLNLTGVGARPLLTDFETGVEGWWTNPWGGGSITVAASGEARFGRQALRADFALRDGKLQGNLVGPFWPADAPWRSQPWGALSLWYRTAGELPQFGLSLGVAESAGQPERSFSTVLPASATWRRLVVEPAQLWNRQGETLDLRRLGRVIVSGARPGTVWLDQLTLVPPFRLLPLEPYATTVHLLDLGHGQYEVEAPGERWSATLTVPGGQAQATWQGEAEPRLALRAEAAAEGLGRLVLNDAQGSQDYRFPVLLPQPRPELAPAGIFPTPQQFTAARGQWPVAGPARAWGPAAALVARRLTGQLARRGVTLTVTCETGEPGRQGLTVGSPPSLEPPADLPPEGYRLRVTPAGAAISARDDRGLFYGTLSLLQLIAAASPPGQPLVAPAVEVTDWPAVPFRAASLSIPTARWGYPNNAPVSPGFFIEFLERTVVSRKLNHVLLVGENGLKFASLPKVASATAWDSAQLGEVLDYLRANLVEPIPVNSSLGHANWLGLFYPEVAERGAKQDPASQQWSLAPDPHTLNTREPVAWERLRGAYEEVLAWFKPRLFHIGHDEVRWQTHLIPPELRGANDTIDGRAEQFAAWVRHLHGYLAERGVGMMMWTDMLTAGHNGGPPYQIARALPAIPRDTWMVNWSSSLAPLHTYELRSLGFEHVLEGNSEGLNRERGLAVAGNVVGIWSKVPWCSETVGETNHYNYQLLTHGAEYSWRLHPDLSRPKPAPTRDFMAQVAAIEALAAWQPEPAAGPTPVEPLTAAGGIALSGWFQSPPGPLAVLDIQVPLWSRAVGAGGQVAVDRRAAALYLALAAEVEGEALTALRNDFKDPAWYAGRPLGELRVHYADGGEELFPLKFGWDVRSRRPAALPAAYGALGWAVYPAAEGETAVYLRQWVNPQPAKVIERLTLTDAGTPARLLLLGAAVRPAR